MDVINANHDIGDVLKQLDNNWYILKADAYNVVKPKPDERDNWTFGKEKILRNLNTIIIWKFAPSLQDTYLNRQLNNWISTCLYIAP
jgi:hypothetical protein